VGRLQGLIEMPSKEKKFCFVLMPFTENLKEVYWKAIKPACIKTDFESLRVDELKGPFNINRKIIEHIFLSDAIVADLTEWNPNVFYEMGVAHAIDNKTIMIIQKKDALPFDVSNYRCIQYEQTKEGLEELMNSIADALNSIEEWRKHPTNPVQDFKPFEALIPKMVLERLQIELRNKDKLLAESVLRADWEALQRNLEQKQEENWALLRKLDSIRSQIVRTTPLVHLRSQPRDNVSHEEVKAMLKEKNLFDKDWNEGGRGLQNLFDVIERHNNHLVVDYITGLTWQQSGSEDQLTYAKAKKYIIELVQDNFGGYNDWRLPTLEEAMSLMERERQNGDLYIDPAFDRKQGWIWTADTENVSVAWVVNFAYGICLSRSVDDSRYVRAVR
jgi:hypothetical protein